MRITSTILTRGLVAACVLAAGCGRTNDTFVTPDRLDHGLVIVLPGIEGESPANRNIRDGLVAAGVDRAVPIYRWGRPVPGVGLLLNQMDSAGNRRAGADIARMIVAYQDTYPGRPVHLVGHSGGGGVAVFAAESLPEECQIDGLVLLSASLSHSYDLTAALGKCRNGILNFYRPDGLLVIGTTLAGNVDGRHGRGAGAIGFDPPEPDADSEKTLAYTKLFQREMTPEMIGPGGNHYSATRPQFIWTYVMPWVVSPAWPAAETSVATR